MKHKCLPSTKALTILARAWSISLSQGIDWSPTGEREIAQLGAAKVRVWNAEFIDTLDWSTRPAPPQKVEPISSKGPFEGTLDELRQRLAVITMIDVLVGCGVANDDRIAAAIGFLSNSVGPTPIPEEIAYVDFVVWRALSGDLAAWFELRFAKSRVFAS